MIVVVAALKGGVGKTTTSVYLAAVAARSRRSVTLVDADPQASAAEWVEGSADETLQALEVVEAPTDRLLTKALTGVRRDHIVIVDSPPGQERMLVKALERASAAVVPTRVGGVETATAEAALDLIPNRVPSGLVICSARTYTRDYHEALSGWAEAGVNLWGTVPERVAIAAGPTDWLSADGIDAYRHTWRRVLRSAR
jgi:chromosome partitioning protein